MIEEYLINYGVLGLWTMTLLIDKIKFQKKMINVVESNTQALILVKERMKR